VVRELDARADARDLRSRERRVNRPRERLRRRLGSRAVRGGERYRRGAGAADHHAEHQRQQAPRGDRSEEGHGELLGVGRAATR
jgi:hypothetical protein